ncbi:MAG: hypothetical protein IKM29_06360 [Clostridia bacterium]|nr:hypothetical protein [Clostridia bacterium]
MENKFENEQPAAVEYGKFVRLRGSLLKLGFFAVLGLMSVGTLVIILYTFIGRGFIG